MKKLETSYITDLPFKLGTVVISFGPYVDLGVVYEDFWIRRCVIKFLNYKLELEKVYNFKENK